MNKFKLILGILILFTFFIACGDKNNYSEQMQDTTVQTQDDLLFKDKPFRDTLKLDVGRDYNDPGTTHDGADIRTGSYPPLPGKELVQFLPLKIANYKSLKPSFGESVGEDFSYVSAIGQYYIPEKSSIVIRIEDYGTIKEIPDEKYLKDIPTEPGSESVRLDYGLAKGFMVWFESKRGGYIYLFFDDRFIIKIETDRLGKEFVDARDIVKLLSPEKISAYAKSYKY